MDLTDRTAPHELGFWPTTNFASDVSVISHYAYVTDSQSGLHVIDVSNPAAPIEVGSYDTPGSANHVVALGGTAFVADGYSGFNFA